MERPSAGGACDAQMLFFSLLAPCMCVDIGLRAGSDSTPALVIIFLSLNLIQFMDKKWALPSVCHNAVFGTAVTCHKLQVHSWDLHKHVIIMFGHTRGHAVQLK